MRGPQSAKTRRARALRRNQTEPERLLWSRLRGRQLAGHKFVRQEPIGPYIADFCCREAKLVIELDGDQHAGSIRDTLRDAYLVRSSYRVLRFWNHQVMREMQSVLETVFAHLAGGVSDEVAPDKAAPHPNPLPACGERESLAPHPSPLPVNGEREISREERA